VHERVSRAYKAVDLNPRVRMSVEVNNGWAYQWGSPTQMVGVYRYSHGFLLETHG